MNEATLATRVRALIDTHHGGSVNAAAREAGIPQPTLLQIASGKVTNPRANTVARIAYLYGATVHWLVTGHGNPPSGPALPYGAGARLERLTALVLAWCAAMEKGTPEQIGKAAHAMGAFAQAVRDGATHTTEAQP